MIEKILIVREIKSLLNSKKALFIWCFFSLVYVLISIPAIGSFSLDTSSVFGIDFNNSKNVFSSFIMIYISLIIGMFVGFQFLTNSLYKEKQLGILESILSSPVSLASFFRSKIYSTTIVGYFFAFCCSFLIGILSYLNYKIIPNLFSIIFILVIIPVFYMGFFGMIVFFQLILGSKVNQIINLIVVFLLIFLMNMFKFIFLEILNNYFLFFCVFVMIFISLVLLSFFLIRFLDKEKIILAID